MLKPKRTTHNDRVEYAFPHYEVDLYVCWVSSVLVVMLGDVTIWLGMESPLYNCISFRVRSGGLS